MENSTTNVELTFMT